jgi:two-component system OmpR family response regulator
MGRICKILVVEDNDSIRDFLQSLFDDEGYQIALVAGGEEMHRAFATERFDVALIDVTLPGAEDGFALAQSARSTGCGVILVTGDTRHFDRIEASGHPYLLKPFRIERLLDLVTEIIRNSDCALGSHRRQR